MWKLLRMHICKRLRCNRIDSYPLRSSSANSNLNTGYYEEVPFGDFLELQGSSFNSVALPPSHEDTLCSQTRRDKKAKYQPSNQCRSHGALMIFSNGEPKAGSRPTTLPRGGFTSICTRKAHTSLCCY